MRLFGFALGLTLPGMLLHAAAKEDKDEIVRFRQDRFAIGFWVDPPADDEMEDRYREIAEAHFTLVLGGFGARTPETVRKQLDLCQRHGLVALVSRAGLPPEELPEHPACWGYMIKDEPNASDFPGLRDIVDRIRTCRPGQLSYINLYPNYANERQMGCQSYEEYVDRFLEEVNVDVLSMDHYPLMRPCRDGRQGYCDNLDVLRKQSLDRGIPFWNFFNIMPFGAQFDPTEAQVRWQIYTSLAYGAKGVLYFCYWTPRGDEFPKGGAILTAEGERTRHYDQAQRINAKLKNWGPTLMKLTTERVVRIPRENDPSPFLQGTPLETITEGDYLLGLFRHEDGRQAVLLNNYDFAYTAWPTVVFRQKSESVTELDPVTGDERPVRDDSPAMEGLQLSLDAAEGRLFLMPGVQ